MLNFQVSYVTRESRQQRQRRQRRRVSLDILNYVRSQSVSSNDDLVMNSKAERPIKTDESKRHENNIYKNNTHECIIFDQSELPQFNYLNLNIASCISDSDDNNDTD